MYLYFSYASNSLQSVCFQALEEKAKGDWKKLTIAEKKQLYRINYCQTFAEMDAPTGEWKSVVGAGLVMVSLGVWLYMFVQYERCEWENGILKSPHNMTAPPLCAGNVVERCSLVAPLVSIASKIDIK